MVDPRIQESVGLEPAPLLRVLVLGQGHTAEAGCTVTTTPTTYWTTTSNKMLQKIRVNISTRLILILTFNFFLKSSLNRLEYGQLEDWVVMA